LRARSAGAPWPRCSGAAAAEELKVPDNVPTDQFDFETKVIEGWTTVDGQKNIRWDNVSRLHQRHAR